MNSKYDQMLRMLREQIRPAVGCTEPGSAAYAAAVAARILGAAPERLTVCVSRNILKNAMGVGIPGTDQVGLPIAVALGALCGDAEAGLAALHDVDQAKLERAQTFVDEQRVQVRLSDTDMKLYIDVLAEGEGHSARAVIAGAHTRIVLTERDGVRLDDGQAAEEGALGDAAAALSLRAIDDFVRRV
ncbi:MAG: serine dehydratase subunit alpha family protein, partial [Aristaeellaceae bacterium]